ncbi:MAG: 1-deoxy-D-xylulose-5-phosphate synthase [Candidatus Epulonipiscioides saccharophilum]|nr:MAG: 1-deoxy-D-xylulose-5-phosphate synthase [Epulopiscium sp. AS2M-Bin001]
MFEILREIRKVSDIKLLDTKQLELLSKDIRKFLIKSITKTGGHLASNLGVVELTLALHYVFDSPKDKIIWDVGHQTYTHKILTSRKTKFNTLRQFEGLSGFLKRHESPHDIFETGHSSTSISAAFGIATARDLQNQHFHVLAVIGDGALTGGMAFEALNHAGRSNTNLIVILNDNEMSISKNVGGMSRYLTSLRTNQKYQRSKVNLVKFLSKIPKIGKMLMGTIKHTKNSLKNLFIKRTIFEQMGFKYFGPIDGHNIDELIKVLSVTKELNGPILIHVNTLKGKGYFLAEKEPTKYHGIASKNSKLTYTFSDAFGDAMVKLASKNKKIVGITAAMTEGVGLKEFSEQFPDRFFDVAIAEQHAVTFACGLAIDGIRPVVAIYSSFLQRAYDQILHDCALQNLPVIFAIDRSGLVGEDGQTHQGIFDIAYLSHIPNMVILSPKCPLEIESALNYALMKNGPVAIRYPRGSSPKTKLQSIDYLKNSAPLLHIEGKNILILATGKATIWALDVCNYLKIDYNIHAGLAEIAMISPLDVDSLVSLVNPYDVIVTIEDHVLIGGFSSLIINALISKNISKKYIQFGYKNGIIEHGKIEKVLEKNQLQPHQIAETIKYKIQEL